MGRSWKGAWIGSCLWLLATSSLARAEEAPPPPKQRHWYGGRILIGDGASIALFASGWAFPPLGVVGATGWFLGAPIQHGVHAGPGRAWGSFGLRFGLPLVGLVGGALIGYSCPGVSSAQHCSTGGGVIGAAAGFAAAEALDVAWLARDEHPAAQSVAAAGPAPQLVLAPRPGGGLVGLVGLF
jgi:hypothetical protein